MKGTWTFVGMTCLQIIEEILLEYSDCECEIVEGSITPIIDDPSRMLPSGECEECGGPCRWEYASKYEDVNA
jgi:hypothetical protein